jgi:hypothetical protein
MSDTKSRSLSLKILRVRTRLAASVKTGSVGESLCPSRTDPTAGGEVCPTGLVCPTEMYTCNDCIKA